MVEIDLRVGGRFRIGMQPPDRTIHYVRGRYLEVEPPRRLVFTWSWEGTPQDDGYESVVTVDIVQRVNECELILTHERLPAASIAEHRAGWTGSFDRLANVFE